MIVYDGDQFPSEYRGDAFAAQHGSWNRAKRTGYKVIRARLEAGVPTGEYEDFMTGFVVNDSSVWARPVGVAVAHVGALLVSEEGNGTVLRVPYRVGPVKGVIVGVLFFGPVENSLTRPGPGGLLCLCRALS